MSAISFSKQAEELIRALARDSLEWRYGYDLMKETGLKSGSLYPILARLADQGLVEAEWRESPHAGKPQRHVYRLTSKGRATASSIEALVPTVSTHQALACRPC